MESFHTCDGLHPKHSSTKYVFTLVASNCVRFTLSPMISQLNLMFFTEKRFENCYRSAYIEFEFVVIILILN